MLIKASSLFALFARAHYSNFHLSPHAHELTQMREQNNITAFAAFGVSNIMHVSVCSKESRIVSDWLQHAVPIFFVRADTEKRICFTDER